MENPTVTAGLIAVVLVLAELLKWSLKKYGNKDSRERTELTQNDLQEIREANKSISIISEDLEEMKTLVTDKLAVVLRDISECMKKVSETQYKMSELLEKIDRRQEVSEAVNKAVAANNVSKDK